MKHSEYCDGMFLVVVGQSPEDFRLRVESAGRGNTAINNLCIKVLFNQVPPATNPRDHNLHYQSSQNSKNCKRYVASNAVKHGL